MLQDKVAIVTGASRGIGRAIALELGRRGARVVVNYRSSAEAAAEVVAAIEEAGGRAIAVQADVGDFEQAARLVQTALDEFDRVDILVNNAGTTRDQLLMLMKEEDWDLVLKTNLYSIFYVTQAVLPMMLNQRYGRIINISSIVAFTGNPGQVNYASAKAGIIGFTKALALEVAGRNITVNAVAPGFIETDMTKNLPEKIKETFLSQIPMKRIGLPEEVAALVTFLASDKASYITGAVFHINGGLYRG